MAIPSNQLPPSPPDHLCPDCDRPFATHETLAKHRTYWCRKVPGDKCLTCGDWTFDRLYGGWHVCAGPQNLTLGSNQPRCAYCNCRTHLYWYCPILDSERCRRCCYWVRRLHIPDHPSSCPGALGTMEPSAYSERQKIPPLLPLHLPRPNATSYLGLSDGRLSDASVGQTIRPPLINIPPQPTKLHPTPHWQPESRRQLLYPSSSDLPALTRLPLPGQQPPMATPPPLVQLGQTRKDNG
ncbi:hypothetical protein BC936DRAFT_139419 [Jimgerdemannia flammicorona]|uniref:C2H2-type domain-containing protein n=1 Tax=Jimgerdemannia flammicorona TaxID=994334 RepID=A0A433B9X7_9FUNG|nr:hypothetical protein BC936DRAFT_139419 [Jimgerdemannia flammicorona]